MYHSEQSDAAWTEAEHLAAVSIDVQQLGNWQRAGKDSAPKPKPIPRPSDLAAAREAGERHAGRAAKVRERQAARRQMLEEQAAAASTT